MSSEVYFIYSRLQGLQAAGRGGGAGLPCDLSLVSRDGEDQSINILTFVRAPLRSRVSVHGVG